MSWPIVELGKHLDFITSGSRGWSQYVRPTGARFIRIQNVGRNELLMDDMACIQPPSGAESARTRVQTGDVLVSITADLARTAVIPDGFGEAYINQHLALMRPRDFYPPFLASYVALGPGRKQLLKRDKVGVKSGLNFDDLRSLRVPLPPLPEQRRIADILDKADAIRRKRKEAIAMTEALLRSAFLEMFGDPVTNPKGWRTVPLDELIDQERGISYGVVQRGPEIEGGVPVVRISNFGDCRFDGREVVHTSNEISSAYKRTILRGGELVVSIRGTVGRVAIVPASASGWNVSREVAVVPLLPGVSRALVHRALLGDSLQRFMLGNVKGVAQSGINLKDLRLAPIPAPSPTAIKKFESFVATTEALENRIMASVLSSGQLMDTLVDRAFSGSLNA